MKKFLLTHDLEGIACNVHFHCLQDDVFYCRTAETIDFRRKCSKLYKDEHAGTFWQLLEADD